MVRARIRLDIELVVDDRGRRWELASEDLPLMPQLVGYPGRRSAIEAARLANMREAEMWAALPVWEPLNESGALREAERIIGGEK